MGCKTSIRGTEQGYPCINLVSTFEYRLLARIQLFSKEYKNILYLLIVFTMEYFKQLHSMFRNKHFIHFDRLYRTKKSDE